MKKMLVVMAVVLLSGCASYSGSGLAPGSANLDDVLRTMGPPAMRWDHADGSKQLSYPRGPSSPESFMVNIGTDGKLQSIRNTLQPVTMGRIKPGLTKEDVLHLLGPSEPSWTAYSPALNELAWDWRYLENGKPAHFIVVFDNTTGLVRSSMIIVSQLIANY